MSQESESIRMRREIYGEDVARIARWMEDDRVIAYLNESQNVETSLREALQQRRLPVFTPQFNRNGSFFLVSTARRGPIGFLRLIPQGDGVEMVVVIGERDQWGKGYGRAAIRKGVRHAFFEWRKEKIVAKIHRSNERSKRVFRKAGFSKRRDLPCEEEYALTLQDMLA